MFIERIPFVETRDYVRLVQRNADIYRMLYVVALKSAVHGRQDEGPPQPQWPFVVRCQPLIPSP